MKFFTALSFASCIAITTFVAPVPAQEQERPVRPQVRLPVVAQLFQRGEVRILPLGEAPPNAEWGPWRRGEPIELGGGKAPPCTVFAFYASQRSLAAPVVDGDADYLADLQRRFADKGLRIVAAIGDPELKVPDTLANCSVVVDIDARVAAAWDAAGPGMHVVAIDGKGRVVFQGDPGHGLVDAITESIAGTWDLAKARERVATREVLVQGGVDNFVSAKPDLIVANAGADGSLLGAAYLVAGFGGGDSAAAKELRREALARLGGEWRPLAVFADLALRCDDRAVDAASEIAAALQPAAAGAPNDPFVQLAYLRALVVADRGREVGRQAARAWKVAKNSAVHALAFGEILTHAPVPAVHKDLIGQAARRVEELGGDQRLLTALRYTTALRCDEDCEAAKALLATYLTDVQVRTQINNDCWYLMTEVPTLGRFPWFTAGLAERMLEQRDGMDYFEFDTVALAMFTVGRVKEAVELQETAIQKGGQGNPEYTNRLERYRARVAPAPR